MSFLLKAMVRTAAAVLAACALSVSLTHAEGRNPSSQGIAETIDAVLSRSSDTVEFPHFQYMVETRYPSLSGEHQYMFLFSVDTSAMGPGVYRLTQNDMDVFVSRRLPNENWVDLDPRTVQFRMRPETFTLTITKNTSATLLVTVADQTMVYGEPFRPSFKAVSTTTMNDPTVAVTSWAVDGVPYTGAVPVGAGQHRVSCTAESALFSKISTAEGVLTVLPQTRFTYEGPVPEGAPAPPVSGSASYHSVNALPKVEAPDGYSFSGWSSPDVKAVPGGFTVAGDCPSVVRFTGAWTAQPHSLTFLFEGKRVRSFTLRTGDPVRASAETARLSVPEPARGYEFSGWENLPETMPARDLVVEGGFRRIGYAAAFLVDGREVGWSLLSPGDAVIPVGLEQVTAGLEEGQYLKWEDYPALMPERDITVSGYVVTIYSTRQPGTFEKSLCALNILFALACLAGFLFSASGALARGRQGKSLAAALSAVPAGAAGFMLAFTTDFSRPVVSGDAFTPAFALLALFQVLFSVVLYGHAGPRPHPGRTGGRDEAGGPRAINAPGGGGD